MLASPRFRLILFALAIILLSPGFATAQTYIQGTVTFWGDPGGFTDIEVAAHTDPHGPPDVAQIISYPGGAYSLQVPDDTYFVSALLWVSAPGVLGDGILQTFAGRFRWINEMQLKTE